MTGGLLVFSLPQCGSKALTEALGAHPELRCFNEPFNPNVPDPTGLRTRSPTLAQLDASIHSVWASWPVIEHIWDPSGWPFPRNSALNGHVLLGASRVVLLSRRNVLQLVVANAIALQRAAASADPAGLGPEHPLGPLDIAPIRWQLKQVPGALRTQRRVLYARDRPVLDLGYEDLFGPDLDPATRGAALERVFAFFGYSIEDPDVDQSVIRQCVDPDAAGVEAIDWRSVPNADEIEEQLGSDETGWLLR